MTSSGLSDSSHDASEPSEPSGMTRCIAAAADDDDASPNAGADSASLDASRYSARRRAASTIAAIGLWASTTTAVESDEASRVVAVDGKEPAREADAGRRGAEASSSSSSSSVDLDLAARSATRARSAASLRRSNAVGASVTGCARGGEEEEEDEDDAASKENQTERSSADDADRDAAAAHQQRAPVRARRVDVVAVAAVLVDVRVLEHPHRALGDVEPRGVERARRVRRRGVARGGRGKRAGGRRRRRGRAVEEDDRGARGREEDARARERARRRRRRRRRRRHRAREERRALGWVGVCGGGRVSSASSFVGAGFAARARSERATFEP
eukprot:30886-Pelagococcus_subviridis.AAC.21